MRVVSILLCIVTSALAFSPHPIQTTTPRHQSSLQMDAVTAAEVALPVGIMLAAVAASLAKAPVDDDASTDAVSASSEPAGSEPAEQVAVLEEEEAPKSGKAVRVLKKLVAPWRKWENIQ
jgi:hypothetical protein